jgi:thioredoxin reductase
MKQTELAIIGAGPAGLSAAIAACHCGVGVTVIDENVKPGGQLFKQIHKFFGSQAHYAGTRGFEIGTRLVEQARECGVNMMLQTVCWNIFSSMQLALVHQAEAFLLQTRSIILATGASGKAISFPGCTLPGIMTAGAAQTMVNVHRVLPGREVLIVGSGNVGLIVAYQLMQASAHITAVVEAAPEIGGYGVHAAKLTRHGVPILVSHTIKEAQGDGRVQRAIVVELDEEWQPIPHTEQAFGVDTICLTVGLSPLAELSWLAGCQCEYSASLGGYVPLHDEDMRTTVPGIFAAGDCAGVEEASIAIEEGKLAGLSAAQYLGKISDEAAYEAKQEIHETLAMLRSGPFGEVRARAKAQLVTDMLSLG